MSQFPNEKKEMPILSPAEAKILPFLLRGLREKEIAQKLGKSVRTIDNQIRAIYAKYAVHSKGELTFKVLGDSSK